MNKLSLIVAAFNEEQSLPRLYERIVRLDWHALGMEIEIIFVDDHSRDRTLQILRGFAAQDSRVKWLRFSRNFGSHKAFTAGLEYATGDAAVILAADLQDPPETIPLLVDKWRAGAKVVWAVRGARAGESRLNKIFARLYYLLMRRYAIAELPQTGADFLLMDRVVMDALRAAPERNTSLLALVQWMGFEQAQIVYTKEARQAGVSKWTFFKRIKLAVDSFVSFSYVPIRLMSLLGFCSAALGFLYALFLVIRRILYEAPIEGWTSLICVVLITSGVQLIMLGVLGEYLWRTFDESRRRPRYLIEASHGIDGKAIT
ncbi:MAG TPA: glycosyltransferase family 2 protein [Verrucomicrobiae bacterium]|nr:glycosyltransferase family 2 protein [Verrucomicrobiae bacterium]